MASMLNMRNGSAIASSMMIRADLYHKLALGNDTMGVDRNSIENDLWVNIVDVVILVSICSSSFFEGLSPLTLLPVPFPS